MLSEHLHYLCDTETPSHSACASLKTASSLRTQRLEPQLSDVFIKRYVSSDRILKMGGGAVDKCRNTKPAPTFDTLVV